MTLDEQIRSALRIAKHIAETGGDGLEERQVDEIKALITNQVREARIDEIKFFAGEGLDYIDASRQELLDRIKELGE